MANFFKKLLAIGLLSFSVISSSAQSAGELWADLQQAAKENDVESVKYNARRLLYSADATEAQKLPAWKLYSAVLVSEKKLWEVWKCAKWFENNLTDSELHSKFLPDYSKLLDSYYQLVEEDRNADITEGIFVSLGMDKKGKPRLVMRLSRSDDGFFKVSIPAGSVLADGIKNAGIGEDGIQSYMRTEVSKKEDGRYIAFWGRQKTHVGSEAAANSAMESAHEILRDSHAEFSTGHYTLGQTVAGTAISSAAAGLMVGLGSLMAKGSTKVYSYELEWTPMFNGMFQASLTTEMNKETTTGGSKHEKTIEKEMMFKLYPHMAVMFSLNGKELISHNIYSWEAKKTSSAKEAFADMFQIDPAWETVKAIDQKMTKASLKKINKEMYKYFLRDVVLEELGKDHLHDYMPEISQMDYDYTPYKYYPASVTSGRRFNLLFGPKIDKNTFSTRQYCVEIEQSGISFMAEFRHTDSPQIYAIYDMNPGTDDSEFKEIGVQKGDGNECDMKVWFKNGAYYEGDGELTRYGCEWTEGRLTYSADNWFEGHPGSPKSGTETLLRNDLRIEFTWEDDEITRTKAHFPNGDIYEGEFDDDFLPNGIGTLTQVDGTVIENCEFEHGVRKIEIVEPEPIKKPVAKRKTTKKKPAKKRKK